MLLRIKPVPQEERVCDCVKVRMPQGKQPGRGRKRQDPFGTLEERNGAQAYRESVYRFAHLLQWLRPASPGDSPGARAGEPIWPRVTPSWFSSSNSRQSCGPVISPRSNWR